MLTTLLFILLFTTPGRAEDPPEKYLIGNVGVRLDLPRGWTPVKWADWEFYAQTTDKGVTLRAWTTPIQAVPTEGTLPTYQAHDIEQAATFGLGEAKPASIAIVDFRGQPIARNELEVKVGAAEGRWFSVAFPVAGQTFHIATIGVARNAPRAEKALDDLLTRIELRKPPTAVDDGGIIEAQGVKIDLPEGWRKPLETEVAFSTRQIDRIPVKDISPCSLAIHPRGVGTPDVMVTCQGGLELGITDDYTFLDQEALVRPKMFGSAKVAPATHLVLADRMGFLYSTDVMGRGMAAAVVPYDQGVARMWILGPTTEKPWLESAAREAMGGATFSGPHPIGPDQFINYWVRYRPTHPAVIGTGLGLLCAGLATVAGFVALSKLIRKKSAANDDLY